MWSRLAAFGEAVAPPTCRWPGAAPVQLPIGQLTEIVGPPQSGKTHLAWRLLGAAADAACLGLFVDLTGTAAPQGAAPAILVLRPPPERPLWRGLAAALQQAPLRLLVLDAVDCLPAGPSAYPCCMALLRAARRAHCAVVCTSRPRRTPGASCDTPLSACSSRQIWTGPPQRRGATCPAATIDPGPPCC